MFFLKCPLIFSFFSVKIYSSCVNVNSTATETRFLENWGESSQVGINCQPKSSDYLALL